METCSSASDIRGHPGSTRCSGSSSGPSEAEARTLAQARASDEGLGLYRTFGASEEEIADEVWLDPAYSACEELAPDGPAAVILVDRREA